MAITPFLAMTASEMRNVSALPQKIAWMACHFSPYGIGLSNLPQALPSGSVLIMDDITPPHRHDPVLIAEQLSMCADAFQCCGVLLDFQRDRCEETLSIVKHITQALPCPVAVSASYADKLDCPVFLPPVPPSMPLEAHIAAWNDREIWLELSLAGEILTLTEDGCQSAALPYPDLNADGFSDAVLHSHYIIELHEKAARFTLWRTKEDFRASIEEANMLGISNMLGLYQEIGKSLYASQ